MTASQVLLNSAGRTFPCSQCPTPQGQKLWIPNKFPNCEKCLIFWYNWEGTKSLKQKLFININESAESGVFLLWENTHTSLKWQTFYTLSWLRGGPCSLPHWLGTQGLNTLSQQPTLPSKPPFPSLPIFLLFLVLYSTSLLYWFPTTLNRCKKQIKPHLNYR